MENITNQVLPLSQQQRIEAQQNAEQAVIALLGQKPTSEQFHTSSISTYGVVIDSLIMVLIAFVLAAAFVLSSMRLYYIGEIEFYRSIPNPEQARIAGITIVILAEASAILFTIALSVIGKTRGTKTILIILAILSTAIALAGNYYVALHGHRINVFSILEAMAPPILTLGTAFVMKEYMLRYIELRHKAQTAFEQALEAYQKKATSPKGHDRYLTLYANALKDKLTEVNKRRRWNGQNMVELMNAFTSQEWSFLVQREMESDIWYRPAQEVDSVAMAKEAARQPGFLPAPLPVNQHQQD